MKKRIWAHLPPLSLTLASMERPWGYPSHENVQKSTEIASAKPASHFERKNKTMLPGNVPASKFLQRGGLGKVHLDFLEHATPYFL